MNEFATQSAERGAEQIKAATGTSLVTLLAVVRSVNLSQVFGFLTALLGAELIVGWALHNEHMVRILSASNSVSLNTAIGFVIVGSTLTLGDTRRGERVRRLAAITLLVVFSAILVEDIFDVALGLDWATLHQYVVDGSPRPGRVAPNTCVGFLLLGIALFVFDQTPSVAKRLLVGACAAGLILVIGTGVTGLLLDPTLMFGWYKFNRMAAPTSFGLGLLTIAMYQGYIENVSGSPLSTRFQGQRIMWNGGMLLLAMGLAAATTTFIIFANYQQEAVRFRLNSEMRVQAKIAANDVQLANETTRTLVRRPLLLALVAKTRTEPSSKNFAQLQVTFDKLLEQGFSSMQFSSTGDKRQLQSGIIAEHVDLALPLIEPGNSVLFIANGHFFYKTTIHFVSDNGEDLGVLTTERPLNLLSSLYTEDSAMRTAEVVLCGRIAVTIACFPSRLHPGVLRIGAASNRAHLPIDDALAGQSGIQTAVDYRGANVVAAYSPMGKTGLGVVSKADTVDIYAPINYLISRSLIVLFIALAIGIYLLQRTVSPLVHSIVRAEEEAKETAQRARSSEQRLKTITDNVPVLISYIDKNLKYRFANAMYEHWFGIPVKDVIGKTPKELLSEDSYSKSLPRMIKALAGEGSEVTYRSESERSEYPKYVTVIYIPERDDSGDVIGFNVLASDATARSEQEAMLSNLAFHDGLTGLPNRRMFDERLQLAMARSRRQNVGLALLYLDVDHFKNINDSLGHQVGDLLLVEFAHRLRTSIREVDIVSRLGGDEFTIILEHLTSPHQANLVADKILLAIRRPFLIGDSKLQITTSIGISFLNDYDIEPGELIRECDAALYQAKRSGRNCYSI